MRFSLFSKSHFEVDYPVSLIESYCFQSDFYDNYDLLLRNGKRPIESVNKIGARISEETLNKCKNVIDSYLEIPILKLSLDEFIHDYDPKDREAHIDELSHLVKKLDDEEGIGLSKATKILHTLKPKIIPMIDTLLQGEYDRLNQSRKSLKYNQIFIDYYNNFDVKETYDNLNSLYKDLLHLGLTKVRIFDILWWSFLKADALTQKIKLPWTTIRRINSTYSLKS